MPGNCLMGCVTPQSFLAKTAPYSYGRYFRIFANTSVICKHDSKINSWFRSQLRIFILNRNTESRPRRLHWERWLSDVGWQGKDHRRQILIKCRPFSDIWNILLLPSLQSRPFIWLVQACKVPFSFRILFLRTILPHALRPHTLGLPLGLSL